MTGGQSAHSDRRSKYERSVCILFTGFHSFLVEAQTNAGYIQMAVHTIACIIATRRFQFWDPHFACNKFYSKVLTGRAKKALK